ncbi:hypothetical protein [Caldimonas brevitalea]|uniref:Signal recognition particle receptor protein FtsY n=1 Tax=Caldimonas brevitalea TaxID=413882 RepID=A0A0G3BH92_9BURK|nr:hypothetical protein [Caldimonas brevitalea]AKJ28764.1 signal recognition particle receptor protein FtsY [Caldimonas brevitalea]
MNAILKPVEQDQDATAVAILSSIEEVQSAITEFDKVSAGLRDLREKYSNVAFDVASPKGLREATDARAAIRAPRYAVEKVRKAAKAPVLALGRDIDARAAYITAELLQLEEPIDRQIKAEEARKEAEKEAKRLAELARIEAHQVRIGEIRALLSIAVNATAPCIQTLINRLEAWVVGPDAFEEYATAAQRAKDETLTRLREMHPAAVAYEAEQARLKAEREELERLRAEQARREAEERARIAAEQKAEADRLAVERAKQEAELRALREVFEREKAAARAAQEEADRQAAAARAEAERLVKEAREAEERRLAAVRAEQERLAREAEEARLRDEQARSEADKRVRDVAHQLLTTLRAVNRWDRAANALPGALQAQVIQSIFAATGEQE